MLTLSLSLSLSVSVLWLKEEVHCIQWKYAEWTCMWICNGSMLHILVNLLREIKKNSKKYYVNKCKWVSECIHCSDGWMHVTWITPPSPPPPPGKKSWIILEAVWLRQGVLGIGTLPPTLTPRVPQAGLSVDVETRCSSTAVPVTCKMDRSPEQAVKSPVTDCSLRSAAVSLGGDRPGYVLADRSSELLWFAHGTQRVVWRFVFEISFCRSRVVGSLALEILFMESHRPGQWVRTLPTPSSPSPVLDGLYNLFTGFALITLVYFVCVCVYA